MDLLIIGRSRNTVDAAVEQVRARGFTVRGVTTDDEALAALDTGEFGNLLIGGGVEKRSRTTLKERAGRHDVAVHEARRHGRDIATYLEQEVYPRLRRNA
ncbi:hypothetical protein [Nocardia amamiensis]|uniref:hypothetical protein n=1 Tax=Nocardia amamiensis TaxID=404578 RepID=UPI000829A30A|nr:hypothetical protein [Nocardia amamiensis]